MSQLASEEIFDMMTMELVVITEWELLMKQEELVTMVSITVQCYFIQISRHLNQC